MKPKYIKSRWFPPFGRAITLYPFVFIRDHAWVETTIRHETIHVHQINRDGFFYFYIRWRLGLIFGVFRYGKGSYRNISYEREAFANNAKGKYLPVDLEERVQKELLT